MTDKKIISALDSCDVFSKASDATYKELLPALQSISIPVNLYTLPKALKKILV